MSRWSNFLLGFLLAVLGWLTPIHAISPAFVPEEVTQIVAPTSQATAAIRDQLTAYRPNGPPTPFKQQSLNPGVHRGIWVVVFDGDVSSAVVLQYAYAGGDPVNRWDPSGLDWVWNESSGSWNELPGTPWAPKPPRGFTPSNNNGNGKFTRFDIPNIYTYLVNEYSTIEMNFINSKIAEFQGLAKYKGIMREHQILLYSTAFDRDAEKLLNIRDDFSNLLGYYGNLIGTLQAGNKEYAQKFENIKIQERIVDGLSGAAILTGAGIATKAAQKIGVKILIAGIAADLASARLTSAFDGTAHSSLIGITGSKLGGLVGEERLGAFTSEILALVLTQGASLNPGQGTLLPPLRISSAPAPLTPTVRATTNAPNYGMYNPPGTLVPIAANRGGLRSFYSVQGEADAARLTAGGAPWPTGLQRANLGEGLYAWGTRAEAAAYAAGKQGVSILEFKVPSSDYSAFKTLDMRLMSDEAATNWLGLFSQYGQGLPHGYDHIIRLTGRGTEYFFSPTAFGNLR